MKIYKFKDLREESKHSHFTQIITENTIWCASPDSLNDEEEFEFELDYKPSSRTLSLLTEILSRYRVTNYIPPLMSASWALTDNNLERIAQPIIKEIVDKCRKEIGIVSFSTINHDKHLWDEYGGRGNGVFVEINIPDQLIGKSYFSVQYEEKKIFHVDSFFESALFPDRVFETYRNILLTKTKNKWNKEEEMRFIGNRQNVKLILDGYISEITFGPNVSDHVFKYLMGVIGNYCSDNCIEVNRL